MVIIDYLFSDLYCKYKRELNITGHKIVQKRSFFVHNLLFNPLQRYLELNSTIFK